MVKVLFRPKKLDHGCLSCGLSEYETDAIHCKRCGALLASRTGLSLGASTHKA